MESDLREGFHEYCFVLHYKRKIMIRRFDLDFVCSGKKVHRLGNVRETYLKEICFEEREGNGKCTRKIQIVGLST